MKTESLIPRRLLALVGGLTFLAAGFIHAFPPAPHHVIFGQVRNEMGDPISLADAEVILETMNGVQFHTGISLALDPGVNYRLRVPMDAGVKIDQYKPSALRAAEPFLLRVRIGQTLYLPLEMVGDLSSLGQPSESTQMDLTLGEDADGDGLPDAWERALIAALGGTNTLAEINAADDSDGDGLSNGDEYRAGTYAFDGEDGFTLTALELSGEASVLEFLAIRGRSYSIWVSSDLDQWRAVDFRVLAEGSNAPLRISYLAGNVSMLRVQVPRTEEDGARLYFKAMVQ